MRAVTCPHCSNLSLVRLIRRGVIIDRCRFCEGLWFDGGELDQVLRSREQPLQMSVKAQRSERRCPRCHAAMRAFHYPETDVEIDMCSKCDGVWLDAGEYRGLQRHLAEFQMDSSPNTFVERLREWWGRDQD